MPGPEAKRQVLHGEGLEGWRGESGGAEAALTIRRLSGKALRVVRGTVATVVHLETTGPHLGRALAVSTSWVTAARAGAGV